MIRTPGLKRIYQICISKKIKGKTPMTKSKLFLAIVSLMFSGIVSAQPVKKHGQLKVEGTKLVDKNGKAVVLRGVSFGWHNWWPRFYNAGAVKWLHDDWKCNVVRAAMGVEPDKGYLKDSAGSV